MVYTSPHHLPYDGYSARPNDFYRQKQSPRHPSGEFASPSQGFYPSPRYSNAGYYSTRVEFISQAEYVRGTSHQSRRQTRPRPSSSPTKSPPPPLKATEADARKHDIPPGYSLKNWDPTEEPIMLLGSVFDANSLGKWIYDWTVYHHGPATPISDMAGELWLLLIQLAGKVKRAEECMPRIRSKDNGVMVKDFLQSAGRLTEKLKELLKACETLMLKAGKTVGKKPAELGNNAGIEFVDLIFGQNGQSQNMEKFMTSVRLWNLRFDVNCEDILRRPHA